MTAGRIGAIHVVGRVKCSAEIADLLGGQRSSLFYAHDYPRRDDPLIGVLVCFPWSEEVADKRPPACPLGDFGNHVGSLEGPFGRPWPNSKAPPSATVVSSVVMTAWARSSTRRSR
jgi:hypothetical protein